MVIPSMTNKKIERQITVRTLEDIQSAIIPFVKEKKGSDIELTAEMSWTDDKGNRQKGIVSAKNRDLTTKQILIEGFELVKKRMDLAAKMKEQSEMDDEDDDLLPDRFRWELFDPDSQVMHVDKLIKQELDGKRKGLRIRWDLEDGIFEWDPFTGKLFKVDV